MERELLQGIIAYLAHERKKDELEKGKEGCDEKIFSGRVGYNDLDPLREEEDVVSETK